MGYYMVQGRYTQAAVKNLVAHPEDRSKAATRLVKALGGKVHSYFMCFGDYDFMAIMELPDDQAAAATSMAVGAAGHVSDIKTTRLFTGPEAKSAMQAANGAASSIRPPQGK